MVAAIGEPELIDTSTDPRLGRIFMNRTIKWYPAFSEFYGMDDTIERIVGYFRYAAQGLEERKQILYLLGPVGGGKSTLAERLKTLMEMTPIYVLKAGDEISPIFESPLGMFSREKFGDILETKYGIPRRRRLWRGRRRRLSRHGGWACGAAATGWCAGSTWRSGRARSSP